MAKEAIVWDSCIIIDAIQQTAGRYQFIEPMLTRAMEGNLKIVISAASIMEVLYLRDFAAQGMDQLEQDDIIRRWLDNSFIIKRTVDIPISLEARTLRVAHQGLTQTDALILATAVVYKVDTLVTYDGNTVGGRVSLLGLDGQIGAPPLRIKTPDDFSRQAELIYAPATDGDEG